MEAVFGQRDILRIEPEQVLGPQFSDDGGECLIEVGANGRQEAAPARAFGHEFERVLAADIAPGLRW
jgi:hypothetical protein